MFKVVLFMLMLVASNSANAEWVKIRSEGNNTTYVDPATISKTDNIVQMWGVVDLKESKKEEEGKSFLSAKGLQEYDCKETQIRSISLTFYSGNMGGGDVIHSYTDAVKWKWKWNPVTPGSASEAMWKVACPK